MKFLSTRHFEFNSIGIEDGKKKNVYTSTWNSWIKIDYFVCNASNAIYTICNRIQIEWFANWKLEYFTNDQFLNVRLAHPFITLNMRIISLVDRRNCINFIKKLHIYIYINLISAYVLYIMFNVNCIMNLSLSNNIYKFYQSWRKIKNFIFENILFIPTMSKTEFFFLTNCTCN